MSVLYFKYKSKFYVVLVKLFLKLGACYYFDRTFLNEYPRPCLCAWIPFPHLNDHVTKSTEQSNIHVCINNDVFTIVSSVINLM